MQGTTEYTVRVSYVELYNEELTDLLAPNTPYVPDKKRLRIYEDENHKVRQFTHIRDTFQKKNVQILKISNF